MTRRLGRLSTAVVGLLLLVGHLSSPSRADSDSSISVVSQDKSYSFAHSIRFKAEIASASPITKVTLLLTVEGDWQVFKADLQVPEGQTRVAVGYDMDLQSDPIYPFSQVDYWWHVEASDGSVVETQPRSFRYTDNRYDWNEVRGDGFLVYWATDDPALGHAVVRMAQEGLERIQAALPESLAAEVVIYVYPSLGELRSALTLANREWAAGITFPESGIILASAGEGAGDMAELQDTLSHEVAHIAIQQSAGGSDKQVPFWLQEGLATANEVSPDPMLAVELDQALEGDGLFSLTTLCAPAMADQSSVRLFYAQSASLVRYMQNHYGNEVIGSLLAAYGDGADCNGGVERILSLGLDDLESEWVKSLQEGDKLTRPTTDAAVEPAPWIGLIGGGSLLASLFYLLRPRPRQGEPRHE